MTTTEALIAIVLVAALVGLFAAVSRWVWLSRRERRMLAIKYGDLEMFSRRLEEWGVPRSKGPKRKGAP